LSLAGKPLDEAYTEAQRRRAAAASEEQQKAGVRLLCAAGRQTFAAGQVAAAT
jgi:hypothetical protein